MMWLTRARFFVYTKYEMIFFRAQGYHFPAEYVADMEVNMMSEFEKIYSFENLYKAHRKARRGKRHQRSVIEFENNLSANLTRLSESIRDGVYTLSGYYKFRVYDPKEREINALYYCDRVVQHCICDEVLEPLLDKRLIYDNAACRIGKGTHFALDRVKRFLQHYYRRYGTNGYFLKCDIKKFFDSIDHEILKTKIGSIIKDRRTLQMLYMIIDSFETAPGKGLPMGNQTSQWFAIYYLDGFDRIIKERLGIKYYSRYMDDCVLIHRDKEYLKECRDKLRAYLGEELKLEFNSKTQVFPIRAGVDYLGFHTYITENGKVVRKVRRQTKERYKRKMRKMLGLYEEGKITMDDIVPVVNSYHAHLKHGNTYNLRASTSGLQS